MSHKKIFEKLSDDHEPCAKDFKKDLEIPTIDLDTSRHIMLVGKSGVGKTCFLNNLIMKHFAHRVYPWNIIIMSPTYHADDSTITIRDYMFKHFEKHRDKFELEQEEQKFSEEDLPEIFPNNFATIRIDIIAKICNK